MSMLDLGAQDRSPLANTADDVFTTPFEDWCEAQGIHPEAFGAWERFTQREDAR